VWNKFLKLKKKKKKQKKHLLHMLGQQIQKITFGGSKLSSISGESTGVALLKNLSIARRGVINLFIFS
jgi:hypothetical protein